MRLNGAISKKAIIFVILRNRSSFPNAVFWGGGEGRLLSMKMIMLTGCDYFSELWSPTAIVHHPGDMSMEKHGGMISTG
jgi:hypothetical protein